MIRLRPDSSFSLDTGACCCHEDSEPFPAFEQPSLWLSAQEKLFPDRLAHITQKPSGLWIRSAQYRYLDRIWAKPSVAIVGSRAASAAGLEISRTMAWELAQAGVVVISGLARGIDGAAHEGTLMAAGSTIAVMASGVDRIYPSEHRLLAEKICQRGIIVSEWPGKTAPQAWRFPARNRLISGLADLVVLVEADARSGALHTVSYAISQGRTVMAVPRDPLIPGALGPNRLIAEGAVVALNAQSVLAELKSMPLEQQRQLPLGKTKAVSQSRGKSENPKRRSTTPIISAEPLAEAIIQLLGRDGALTIDQLIDRMGELEPSRLSASLINLEIAGQVSRDRRGLYHLLRNV